MRWKIVSALLFVLLVASNLWHLYGAIDVGVTMAYRDQTLYQLANQLKANARLCDLAVRGKSESEVISLLRERFPDDEPFVKEGGVHTLWLSVALDDGGRASACAIDETAAHWARPPNDAAGP